MTGSILHTAGQIRLSILHTAGQIRLKRIRDIQHVQFVQSVPCDSKQVFGAFFFLNWCEMYRININFIVLGDEKVLSFLFLD